MHFVIGHGLDRGCHHVIIQPLSTEGHLKTSRMRITVESDAHLASEKEKENLSFATLNIFAQKNSDVFLLCFVEAAHMGCFYSMFI